MQVHCKYAFEVTYLCFVSPVNSEQREQQDLPGLHHMTSIELSYHRGICLIGVNQLSRNYYDKWCNHINELFIEAVHTESLHVICSLLKTKVNVNYVYESCNDAQSICRAVRDFVGLKGCYDVVQKTILMEKLSNEARLCVACKYQFDTHYRIYYHFVRRDMNALLAAFQRNDENVIKVLLQHGCDMYTDLGYLYNIYHFTPAMFPVVTSNDKLLKLLLSVGLDVNKLTPEVVQYANPTVIRLLLQQDILCSLLCKNETPLAIHAGAQEHKCNEQQTITLANIVRLRIRKQILQCTNQHLLSKGVQQSLRSKLPRVLVTYLTFGSTLDDKEN